MESNNPTKQQQQQVFIKKEPLRVRSYFSLRQHEQQQLAASLRGLRGPPGVSVHPRDLPVKRDVLSGAVDTPQKQHVRSLASFSTNTSSSNGGTGADGIKFTPNVSFKPNTTTTTGTTSTSTESSGIGVDSLLLRAIHSRQPTQQNPQRFNRPKFEGPVRHACDSLSTQQRQGISIESPKENNNRKNERRARSIRLSDLAHDVSHGHLFLPITVPFKQQQQQQQQVKAEDENVFEVPGRMQQELELQDIDTAASTPNHIGKNKTKQTTKQIVDSFLNDRDTPAASLLQDQFLLREENNFLEQDGKLDFVQLCFPELLPPLNISAMEAQQLEAKQQKAKKENSTRTSINNNRDNVPTPLHALPSGRIGQLYIHRSGRVHLRLLTDASCKANSKSDATPEKENTEEQHATSPAAAKQPNKGEISYEVLVGTEGAFAQEVGCLLSETNEFVFLGRCTRKLILTADISTALAPPKKGTL